MTQMKTMASLRLTPLFTTSITNLRKKDARLIHLSSDTDKPELATTRHDTLPESTPRLGQHLVKPDTRFFSAVLTPLPKSRLAKP